MRYQLGSVEDERLFRFNVLKQQGLGAKKRFLDSLSGNFDGPERSAIRRAYDFAVGIEYDHVGLSSEAYLAHPLRVAEMVIGLSHPAEPDTVSIALLHNVLEVGGISADALRAEFGSLIADAIVTLTVDRSQQWDLEYKQAYYDAINASYRGARIVKVLDKLDNIFMLCLNAVDAIRARYLEEINRHVIPIADSVIPNVGDYMKHASKNAQETGYQPIE